MRLFSKTSMPPGSKPIRRQATVLVRRDKDTGEEIEILLEGQESTLSHDGSLDRLNVRTNTFHDCGHTTDLRVAGECLCGAMSCQGCHGNCAAPDCGRPLCRECSRFVAGLDESGTRFCQACFERFQRSRWLRRFLQFLVSPFVASEPGGRT